MVTITISGLPGSGKTTVAKLLEEKLKIKYVYSGDLFRTMAKQHHMSLEEFGKFCENNQEIDKELDTNQLKIIRKGNVIVEGRLAGWLAYQNKVPALKILIAADQDTRVRRIMKREEGNIAQRKQEMLTREKSEAKRYKTYYKIDITDTSIYDLVIDSAQKTPAEIVDIIIEKLRK
ncbi:MAG: AAA family ATPase [Euryarchaeota archaeon]|nr:AAA family ATPase [Euryarchaeota archaeon]